MQKFNILLSDLNVQIKSQYDYMAQFCKDYISHQSIVHINACADESSILKEKQAVPTAPIEICESLCIYRAIAEQLPKFDRFVFHGAAIEYEGGAYLFTAPSGTGKTTHIKLWRKHLGDKVNIINGDKPIVCVDETVTIYGTPWAGKEGYQRNAKAPLKAICILKQGKENNIIRLKPNEAINHLMRQVYLPQNNEALSKTLELLSVLIEQTPVYLLECDISEQAFKTSFNEMTNN